MRRRTIGIMGIFLTFGVATNAQVQEDQRIKEPAKTEFVPHWFMQVQK